ncbi:hypothetical protein AAFF_G00174990 [Aldrovandia affinis]|uniref:Uncharacterized protein n=1 Tax=Aldrovandia affinis TaxID=143900 RepID=A0AAD7RL52_9TELE|nr:hypothetical protein AAFF_G00174990 [Aldrovandia affinis]
MALHAQVIPRITHSKHETGLEHSVKRLGHNFLDEVGQFHPDRFSSDQQHWCRDTAKSRPWRERSFSDLTVAVGPH